MRGGGGEGIRLDLIFCFRVFEWGESDGKGIFFLCWRRSKINF